MLAVPAHAADIQTFDMLDTDSASITKLKVDDIVSGTAPFDKDDQPGDDQSADNTIIRSFDTATYDISYTVTPDSTMAYYRKARVGFTFTLPLSGDVAGFDVDSMGWVDRTPGFEPVSRTVDGVQTLTCYRLLTPTSGAPTVAPGTSSITLAVKVKAADNGTQVQPTVTAWPAWNASSPADTGSHPAAKAVPGALTVSAKVSLNVRLNSAQSSTDTTWDFSKASDAPNAALGQVKGVLTQFTYAIDMRWPDRSKGLRGLELPKGDLSFDVDVDSAYRIVGTDKDVPADLDTRPYAWDTSDVYGLYFDHAGRDISATYRLRGDISGIAQRLSSTTRKRAAYTVYDNGTTTITQTARTTGGTRIHVTVHDWHVDPDQLPKTDYMSMVMHRECSTQFMDSSCKDMQVGEISVGALYVITPTTVQGKPVTTTYGGDLELTVSAKTTDVTVQDAVTTDDTAQNTNPLLLPGSMIQTVWFDCPVTPFSMSWAGSWGTNCKGWNGGDWGAGSDHTTPGAAQALVSAFAFTVSASRLPTLALGLLTWDPDVLDMSAATLTSGLMNWQDGNYDAGTPTVHWGVKPDGSNWTSDMEQSKATIDSLEYYDTYAEAAKHGKVVGAVLASTGAGYVQQSGPNRNARFLIGRLNGKVRADVKTGAVTQMTGDTASWSRTLLHEKAGAPDPDASDDEWRAWAKTQDPFTLYKTLTPDYRYGSNGRYRKASYTANGTLVDPTAGNFLGDSLLVTGEALSVAKTVAQTDEAGKAKTVFDLDKEQRTVDWRITAKAQAAAAHATTLTLTDTLPAGLSYISGSSCVDGTYTASADASGGTTSGCTATEPTATANKDGSTTLVWQVPAQSDGKAHTVDYKTTIGDASDPDTDAKNNQQYVNTVTVRSTYNQATPRALEGTVATAGMRVSRTHSSNLATRAIPLLMELGATVGFRDMLGNYSKDAKPDITAVDILPYDGYHGTLALTGLVVAAKDGASLKTVRVWATDDTAVRKADPLKITRTQVTGWRELTLDQATGKVTVPSGFHATAFALTADTLPGGARFDLDLGLTPKDGGPGDVFTNTWTDGDNKVTVVSQTVDRTVSGVVWTDRDRDGSRGGTADRPLTGTRVTLLDRNGATVRSVTGAPLTAVTGADGSYMLDGVPAGTGYHVRITPADGTDWSGAGLTLKEATGVSGELNSKADPVTTLGVLTAGDIALRPFPAASAMASARYADTWENLGLKGTPGVSLPTTGGRDSIGVLPTALLVATGVLLAGVWLVRRRRPHGAHAA